MLEDADLIEEARNIPLKVIEQLPHALRYQYARIRDDVEME